MDLFLCTNMRSLKAASLRWYMQNRFQESFDCRKDGAHDAGGDVDGDGGGT